MFTRHNDFFSPITDLVLTFWPYMYTNRYLGNFTALNKAPTTSKPPWKRRPSVNCCRAAAPSHCHSFPSPKTTIT